MSKLKNKNHELLLRYPASWWGNKWREALPSGNGRIGAAVYGGIKEETILINDEDLWHNGRRDSLPDVSYTLDEIRRLMNKKEYLKAKDILSDELKARGYAAKLSSPLPLADLRLSMETGKGFCHYSRQLNMETGEVTVKWQDGQVKYKRSLFVSRADDLLVYQIKSNGGLIDGNIKIQMHDYRDSRSSYSKKIEELENTLELEFGDEYICYAVRNDDGSDFGAVMRLIAESGKTEAEKESINIESAGKVLVLLKTFVKGERSKEWSSLKKELSTIDQGYQELLEPHVKIHSRLFNSVDIEIDYEEKKKFNEELLLEAYEGEAPTQLIEKMWAYGRYLLISSTSTQGQPCPLYGLWGGDYHPIWPHHMANENIQMIYWHTFVGGLAELVEAVITYYENLADDFYENARKLFNCRGIYIPAGSTPGIGLPNQIVPVIMNWTGAAGWLAQHFYNYYIYMGNIELLKKKILPFMREAALFYEDFFLEGDDGYYKSFPSVSPENTPGNYLPDKPLAHPMPTTINAAMDFAIAKELLTNLVEGAEMAGVYKNEINKWKEMIEQIPPYQINEDGAVKEWMHPDFKDNYHHRHLSHLYPVFPGQEISEETDSKLFKGFQKAVEKRLVVGLSDQSGWSLAHMANVYARLGDGDSALECLELLSRSCLMNNFYTLHNDWRNMGICLEMARAPFQIDANMGWTSAVQEMLFYSSSDMIKLLPACPEKWVKGRVRDFHFPAGQISFSWDRERGIFEVEIKANSDKEIVVKVPGEFGHTKWQGKVVEDNVKEILFPKGESKHTGGGKYFKIKLTQGDVLYLTT